MRTFRISSLFACLLLLAATAAAQADARSEAQKWNVSEADLAAIKQAATDYCESWYEGGAEKIERAVHPDLAKRIVRTDPQSKNSRLDHMGAMRLYQGVRSGYGKNTPKEKQLKEVTVLDVFGNTASVKAVMSDWIDYMHVAKFNGRWVIVNVLWEMKPQPQPQQ
ncbi:MAG TPA: nuclear transport factor 2 family protein [Pyrinomonadaceae bacterium]